MKCPVCPDTNLNISMRHNIEIDYCPNCRGVWLDRGELDKIIERSLDDMAPPRRDDREHRREERRDDDYRDRERSSSMGGLGGLLGSLGRDDDDYRRHRRKKSFLGELFD